MSRGAKGRAAAVPGAELAPALSPEDRRVLSALRARDEAELTVLVERYHPSMVRLARGFVPSQAAAEEVAQAAAPPAQRTVISLRDPEGWEATEVRALREPSGVNQRVLRHRARARARTALEDHLGGGPVSESGPTCREVVELVNDYLEDALPLPQRVRLEQHLDGCPRCVIYLQQMRAAIAAVGRLPEEDLDPATRAGLLAAFRDWSGSG